MKLPKGVWFSTKRLADGRRVRYGYFGRGRDCIALGREGTPDFYKSLGELAESAIAADTVKSLIVAYRRSPAFKKLRERTQRDYLFQLERVDARFGPLSLKAMDSKKIARHIYEWRDTLAESGVRQADLAMQVLKTLLNWGLSRGYLDFNRAVKVPKLYRSERAEKVWSQAQLEAVEKVAPLPIQHAMKLAVHTGQRQGDLLALRWDEITQSDTVVTFRQRKTGAIATVPVTTALAQLFHEIPRLSDHVLTDAKGVPWEHRAEYFRQFFRKAKAKAGVKDRTFHDLRGTFITRHLAEGRTPHEVALMSGHSLQSIGILEAYSDRGQISRANAERLAIREKQLVCKPPANQRKRSSKPKGATN